MRQFITVLAASLLSACQTHATMREATPADVVAVLAQAKGGDTVRLVGDFPVVAVPRGSYAPALRLDLARAKLTGLRLVKVEGVVVTGGVVEAARTAWKTVEITDSRNVALDGTAVRGGIVGVSVARSADLKLTGLTVSGVGADAIELAGAERVLVQRVTCRDFATVGDFHPDCIQAWPLAGYPARDLTLLDNRADGDMQGIWFGNDGDKSGFDRVRIEHNYFRIGFWHAVGLNNIRGSVVRHNTAISNGAVRVGGRVTPWVRILSGSNNVLCGNDTPDVPPQYRDKPC